MNSQSWLRDVAGSTDGFGGVSPDEDAISSELEVLVIAGEKPTAYKRPGATQRGDPYPRGTPQTVASTDFPGRVLSLIVSRNSV